jgi:hypothetical protein
MKIQSYQASLAALSSRGRIPPWQALALDEPTPLKLGQRVEVRIAG